MKGTFQDKEKYATILTYGCQMNQADSERMMGQLSQLGYRWTDNIEQADLILINTCCVRETAENKVYGKIGELKRLKREKPHLILIITGCMAQKEKESLIKRAPHIDLVLGTQAIAELKQHIEDIWEKRESVVAVYDEERPYANEVPPLRRQGISAWVPIMTGCNNFCTYCIVPYVRGREVSRPLDEIIQEVRDLTAEGFKEITLLGQNVNSYGKHGLEEKVDFADLLEAIDAVEGVGRIRFMTSHPRDMNEKVLSVIEKSHNICHHIHLPLQSGSNAILKRMNRGYTTEGYTQLVQTIREKMPKASITTDIIVGFPGETDELFEESLSFIDKMNYDAAYTFIYSIRSGTPAATMPDQVKEDVKKERIQRLMDLQNEHSLKHNEKLVGETLEVLVEGPSKNDETHYTGRTGTNKIVLWPKSDKDKIGDLVKVRITKAQTWVLKGEAVYE